MIVISHRLSTIQQVDVVICLDEGRVVERGTHEELVEKKGYYLASFSQAIYCIGNVASECGIAQLYHKISSLTCIGHPNFGIGAD